MRPQANVCTTSQWLPVARSHAHSVRTRESLWRTVGSQRSGPDLASAGGGEGRFRSRVGSRRLHLLMRGKDGFQGAKDSSSGVWSFLSGPALVMVMRVALSA